MKSKKILLVIALTLFLGGILAACGGTTLGFYETPQYVTEVSDGRIEIRSYPPLLIAEVESAGTRKEAVNAGFRMLADFIFGNNGPSEKVSMTTPVMQGDKQKIDMTTPVVQTEKKGVWVTQFVMPSKYTLQTLPKPNNPSITIKSVEAKKYAVIVFSGVATDTSVSKYEKKLRDYLEQKGITALAPATYAYYDPPWTLPFMRRNEVMIEIK